MTEPSLFNIHCDESCHLEHDGVPVMAWGAVYWLLRTAYCTEKSGRIRQLQRERDDFRRATGAGGQND